MPADPKDVSRALRLLAKRYATGFGTDMQDPFHTLVATVLSAQTTDAAVLAAYPALRSKYPDAAALASATLADVERLIRTLGLYRTKAKHIIGLSKALVRDHGGTVPQTLSELVALPGVGRKTAAIVLSCCFSVPAIAVDTHVHRVVNRLGWVSTKTAEQTERALEQLVPKTLWGTVNRVLVPFGREVCIARSPKCFACPLAQMCAYPKKTPPPIVAKTAKRESRNT